MKLFAVVLLIIAPLSFILAQPAGPPKERDMVKDLKTKLQLTDNQTKKVESIFDNNKKKMESLFEKRSDEHGDMRKTMDSLMNSTNKEIEKILTKEQKEKFKKMIEERKNEMNKMPPPPPPQGRFDMERGIMPPECELGFNDEGMIEEMDQQEMQKFFASRKERPGMCEHMHTRCGCMEDEGFMPPPPPGQFSDEGDIDIPELEEFFEEIFDM